MEHHLTDRISDYPLLIFPEWEYITQDFKQELLTYVRNGGKLLIIGPKAAALFEKELDVTLLDVPAENINGLEYNGRLAGIKSISQEVRLGSKAKPFGKMYYEDSTYGQQLYDVDGPFKTSASFASYGKGIIAAAYLNLGEQY